MLENWEKFVMIDQAKRNNFFAEVNWNLKDEKTNKCQVIKFTFPNGDKAYIKKKHLFEMLFAIGAPKEQQKMIPQVIRRSRHYETKIGVTTTRDIKKGEKLVFPLKLTLPTFEEEAIAELKHKLHRKGKIIKPETKILP